MKLKLSNREIIFLFLVFSDGCISKKIKGGGGREALSLLKTSSIRRRWVRLCASDF